MVIVWLSVVRLLGERDLSKSELSIVVQLNWNLCLRCKVKMEYTERECLCANQDY